MTSCVYDMSFLDISDPSKRDEIVRDFLKLRHELIDKSENRKVSSDLKVLEREEQFKSINEQSKRNTAAITDASLSGVKAIQKAVHGTVKQVSDAVRSVVWNSSFGVGPYEFYTEKIPIDFRDRYYSIYQAGDGYRIGDSPITIDEAYNLVFLGKSYKGTTGLWSLLMLNSPVEYTDTDLDVWSEIASGSNLGDNPRDISVGQKPRGTTKYKRWVSAVTPEDQSVGTGVSFLPSDIDSLLGRLRLVVAERQAGNIDSTTNEVVAILDELARRQYITKSEYEALCVGLSC